MGWRTYETEDLLFLVELPVVQLDYPLDTVEAFEQIDLALEALDCQLIGILDRHAFERKHLSVFGRHTIHFSTAAAAEHLYTCIRPVVHPQHHGALLRLRCTGWPGGCLDDRHLRWWRRCESVRRVLAPRCEGLALGRRMVRCLFVMNVDAEGPEGFDMVLADGVQGGLEERCWEGNLVLLVVARG